VTREPGGTPVGEALRALLLDPANAGLDGLTELFILEASRRAHVRSIIRPALARGDIVIADRFADSSVAYQGGGRELGVALVEHLNALATDGLEPDLTFLLDLDPDAGLARVARRDRSSDRMEQERIEFHRRVRAAYLELGNRCASRYLILDGQLPADEIARQVLASIQPRL
jgi:dTMP kinase